MIPAPKPDYAVLWDGTARSPMGYYLSVDFDEPREPDPAEPSRGPMMMTRILDLLRSKGPMTTDELCLALGAESRAERSTVTDARSYLVELGHVYVIRHQTRSVTGQGRHRIEAVFAARD